MRRLFVSEDFDRIGGEIYFRGKEQYRHDPELLEAYEKGYKCGRKEAYEDVMREQYGYNERHYGGDGSRILYRGGQGGGMNYREYDEDEMDDMEFRRGGRRRRDSRGRFE